MSASHITEGADKELQEMIGSYTEDQCFGSIYKKFDDIEDFSITKKKPVGIHQVELIRHGWRLFHKERLCGPRKVVCKVLEWAHNSKTSEHFEITAH